MNRFISLPFVGTAALLGTTLVLAGVTALRIPDVLAVPLDRIDPHVAGWAATGEHTLPEGVVRALDPTSYISRTYRKDSSQLEVFVAFYAQQRAGESMHSPKHCLPGGGWEIWQHGSALIPVNGRQIRVNKYSIENRGARMLMFYWYQSRDRIIANEYMGKILLARDSLFSGHTAGSIVRIILPDTPGAEPEGIAFASKLIPQVQQSFGYTGPLWSE